jgi:hypothetical protein
LRSNIAGEEPAQLWHWYIQLTQAEAAFRLSKSDMGLRPVYHQTTKRVEAHILVCFLALAMRRSLEQWLKAKGLGTCARRLLAELKEVRSLDIVLQVKDRGTLRNPPYNNSSRTSGCPSPTVPNTSKCKEM